MRKSEIQRFFYGRPTFKDDQWYSLKSSFPKIKELDEIRNLFEQAVEPDKEYHDGTQNFEVVCDERSDDINITMLGETSNLMYDLNSDLHEGYNFMDSTEWGCSNSDSGGTVCVNLEQTRSEIFCLILFHELGHQTHVSPRANPEIHRLYMAYMVRESSDDFFESYLRGNGLAILEKIQPIGYIEEMHRQAMIALLSSDIPVDEAIHLVVLARSAGEKQAWAFARRKVNALAKKGFVFGFTEDQMNLSIDMMMASNELAHMQMTIIDNESEDLSSYKPYYLDLKRVQDLLGIVHYDVDSICDLMRKK